LIEEPDNEIAVKVLFFGAARDAAGQGEVELKLPGASTVESAVKQLREQFPDLNRFGRSLLVALNEEYATRERLLASGDELALFPPVSGGSTETAGDISPASSASTHNFFELTTTAIDVGAVARRIVLPECGATVTLDGYAREWTKGSRTLYLVYEAYEPMAQRELERLGNEAKQRFEIAHIGIVHRTGKLEIGETSVVIAVSAPHRKAAFEACEWAIKELKRTVPIWKKEIFEDGEVWVEGEGELQG
jgi:molybdopterin synthase catalytic subunit